MLNLEKETEHRYWQDVDPSGDTDCWIWTGSQTSQGYGKFEINKRLIFTHRFAWEIANKRNIPTGMGVRHSCDNPLCVNPAHLSIGTQADNIRDKCERGRQVKGKDHPKAKLTEAQVKEIACLRGTQSYAKIARRYGVNATTVGRIQTGKRWTHLHAVSEGYKDFKDLLAKKDLKRDHFTIDEVKEG